MTATELEEIVRKIIYLNGWKKTTKLIPKMTVFILPDHYNPPIKLYVHPSRWNKVEVSFEALVDIRPDLCEKISDQLRGLERWESEKKHKNYLESIQALKNL